MLTPLFDKIIDTKITKIKEVYDYWQLFTEGAVVDIFTNYCIKKNGMKTDDISLIINQHIKVVSYVEECLIFTLDNAVDFCISVKPDDYTGPEAYCIAFKDGGSMIVE